jgi:hypothetical protein
MPEAEENERSLSGDPVATGDSDLPATAVTKKPPPSEEGVGLPRDDRAVALARRIGFPLLWILLPSLVVFFYYRRQFVGVTDPTAMEVAQVARHVSEGRGLSTSVIRPLGLAPAKARPRVVGPENAPAKRRIIQPDLVHGPLPSLVLGTAMLLWTPLTGSPPGDQTVAYVSMGLYLVALLLTYRLARSLFPPSPGIAIVATAILMLNRPMLQAAIEGGSLTLVACAGALTLLVLHRFLLRADEPDRLPVGRSAFWVGVTAALLYLAEPLLALTVVPVAIAVARAGRGREGRPFPAFLLGYALLAGPWMLRNAWLGVNPLVGLRLWEMAMNTSAFPGTLLYREPDPGRQLALDLPFAGSVARKAAANLVAMYEQLPLLLNLWLAPFFIVGLLATFRSPGVEPVRRTVLGMLGLFALFIAFMLPVVDWFMAFLPGLIVFAVASLYQLLQIARIEPRHHHRLAALVVLVTAVPTMAVLGFGTRSLQAAQVREQTLQFTTQVIRMGDWSAMRRDKNATRPVLVATDVPWEQAWYGNRAALWLPADERAYTESVRRLGFAPDLVLLSHGLVNGDASATYGPWRLLVEKWKRTIDIERDDNGEIAQFFLRQDVVLHLAYTPEGQPAAKTPFYGFLPPDRGIAIMTTQPWRGREAPPVGDR